LQDYVHDILILNVDFAMFPNVSYIKPANTKCKSLT